MLDRTDSYFSTTLEKGLGILNLFDREHPCLGLAEISGKVNINKTSTYRYLNTLVKLGFLIKNPQTKQLSLGPKAVLSGHKFFQGFNLLHSIKPIMDQIFKEEEITIDTALFDGKSMMALYRRESSDTIFFRQPLENHDFHSRAMGKAILSRLSHDEVIRLTEREGLKKHTEKTIVEKDKLFKELNKTKIRGYSVNNEEFLEGLISIGAAFMNFKQNKVIGAVSFDFSTDNYSIEKIQKDYTGTIKKFANDISEIITVSNYQN